jgi:hypothetical protein
MTRTKLAIAGTVAMFAIGSIGCGQGAAPGSRPVPKAQEITRASSETFGDYIVHFNAQSTTMLPAEVARAFGIRRSGNRAMLNVTVLRRGSGEGDTPVEAEVAVRAINLLGQLKDVSMRELREGEAIYYIGEITVANEEIVTFNISVRPAGAGASYEFKFQQQFYTN